LTDDGKVICWNDKNSSQSKLPKEYKNLKFIAVSAGVYHSLALTNDGKVIGWGDNEQGQSNSQQEIIIPYNHIAKINHNLKTLGNIPKYIKMEMLEQFNWSFWNLYHL
jgi:alpha-tubulin suppressor-like RCC1 family protein